MVEATAVRKRIRIPVQMTLLSSSSPEETSLITITLSPSDAIEEKKETYAAT